MKLRRAGLVLLMICLTVVAVTLGASASSISNGSCGQNVTWSMDYYGTLTISGIGKMDSMLGQKPWSASSVRKVIIEEGVTSIGEWAFYDCDNLTEVSIADSVTSIDEAVFYDCDSIRNVTIPKGVTVIKENAFYGCDNLQNITFSRGLKKIMDLAFYGCGKVVGLAFPDTLTYIGNSAFELCSKLVSVTIPGSVTRIGDYAFANSGIYVFIRFAGNAPKIENAIFTWVRGTVNYPSGNRTWTSAVRQKFGGDLTWVAEEGLAITKQPKTAYARLNTKAKVTVKATGSDLTYTWYHKNANGRRFVKAASSTNTYSVTMTDTTRNRSVYCVVTDAYGNSIKTKTVTLRMAASITGQPLDTSAPKGRIAKLSIWAVGDGLTYQWYYKDPGDSRYRAANATGRTYSIAMTNARNGRWVYCVVTDKYGKSVRSDVAQVGIPVRIARQPVSVYAYNGTKAKVTVKAVGDELFYTWYHKNAGASRYTIASSTTATYTATMNSKADGRYVYCVITDLYGNTAKSNVVRLRMR